MHFPQGAELAAITRCPTLKSVYIAARRDDVAGQFMAEDSRGHDHPSMVTAAKNLDVRAAGQSNTNPYQQIARANWRDGDGFDAQAFPPVQHRRHHVFLHSVHLWGCTMTFKDSTVGCSAR